MKNFTIILIMLISTLGPSAVIAAVGFASVRALGRNPSAAPKILLSMILAFVFAEAIAILGLLIVYNLFGG
jgi:F-type H+-transporting ATPase subunit c